MLLYVVTVNPSTPTGTAANVSEHVLVQALVCAGVAEYAEPLSMVNATLTDWVPVER